jgi:hypothetical protein
MTNGGALSQLSLVCRFPSLLFFSFVARATHTVQHQRSGPVPYQGISLISKSRIAISAISMRFISGERLVA